MKHGNNFDVPSQSLTVAQTLDKALTLTTQLDNRDPPSREIHASLILGYKRVTHPTLVAPFCVKGIQEFSVP